MRGFPPVLDAETPPISDHFPGTADHRGGATAGPDAGSEPLEPRVAVDGVVQRVDPPGVLIAVASVSRVVDRLGRAEIGDELLVAGSHRGHHVGAPRATSWIANDPRAGRADDQDRSAPAATRLHGAHRRRAGHREGPASRSDSASGVTARPGLRVRQLGERPVVDRGSRAHHPEHARPGHHLVTPPPTASTVPATSLPITAGNPYGM